MQIPSSILTSSYGVNSPRPNTQPANVRPEDENASSKYQNASVQTSVEEPPLASEAVLPVAETADVGISAAVFESQYQSLTIKKTGNSALDAYVSVSVSTQDELSSQDSSIFHIDTYV